MATSNFKRTAVLCSLLGATTTQARDFPAGELEDLFTTMKTHTMSEEEAARGEQISQSLISLFDMKPVHVGESTSQRKEQPEGSQKKEQKQKHGRVVQYDIGGLGWDYVSEQVSADNIGVSEVATMQGAFSWTAPLFLDIEDRYTLLSANPKFNMELFGNLRFTVHLNFIELTVELAMYPFKFTPFDILGRIDTLHPGRSCFGLSYIVQTLLAEVMVETRVNECYLGLAGFLTDTDPSDCVWRTYKPELPVYSVGLESITNMADDYLPYTCRNWYSAEWDNWPLSEDYINLHMQEQAEDTVTVIAPTEPVVADDEVDDPFASGE